MATRKKSRKKKSPGTMARIGPADYKIVRVPYDQLGGEKLGHIMPAEQTIAIRDDLSPQVAAQVINHEITHGIMYHWNITAAIDEALDNDLREGMVDNFSQGMSCFMRDNPELVDFLIESLNDVG